MSTESNRQTQDTSPGTDPGAIKASDFFPPGEGWNQSAEPEQTSPPIRHVVDNGPLEGNKH